MSALPSPVLTIRLLGAFDVRLHGVPVLAFESDKARALLAYLAVESAVPHRRDKLAGLLWPDWSDAEARAHLRHCLHNLRTILHDEAASPSLLLADRHAMQFNPASHAHLDVYTLEAIAATLPADTTQPIDPVLTPQLQQAVACYKGPFLDGFFLEGCSAFQEWMLLTRERLQRTLASLLDRLMGIHEEKGALEDAIQTAHRLVELDPFVEHGQRQLMRLLALSGQRSAALTRYEALRQLLAAELAVEPSPETIRLYQQIQTGQLAGRPVQTRREVSDPLERERRVTTRSNLPAPLTSFVGRERERRALHALLARADVRLVTVLGPAGVGKTRLALEVVRDLTLFFADGVCFISLAELQEPSAVVSAIAEPLGIRQRASQTLLESITTTLQTQQLLLLLDNFEHLLPAALAIADLLATIPGLKIVATSREPLQLYGEHLFVVEPLSLPDDVDQQRGEAVQLFQERAQAVQPTFKLDPANLPTVAEICRVVDGLPLAIELAAACVRLFPVERLLVQLAASFTARLNMLTSVLRNVPDRQRTLRNTMEWSYRLLTTEEQRVFRHVALFVGAFDSSAAATVCGGTDAHSVADCLEALVNKNLLKVNNTVNNRPRFRMLVTLRAFGLEQLALQQEIDTAQLAYVHFYLQQVEQLDLFSSIGEQYRAAREAVTAQYADIRAALLWTLETNELELAMRFCVALSSFWSETSYYGEADQWLRQVVQAAQASPGTVEYAATLYTAGFAALKIGDFAHARTCFERSLAMGIALQNPARIGYASPLLASICFRQGDYLASKTHYATCLQMRQQLDEWFVGLVLVNLAYEEACLGHLEQSLALFDEGNTLLERADEAYGVVVGWIYRTRVARLQGDSTAMQHCLAQAQKQLHHTPARHLQASLQAEMAFVQAQQGQHEVACRTLQVAMQTFDELGYLTNLIETVDVWSAILALSGQAVAAIRSNATANGWLEQRGLVRAPLEQEWLTRLLTPCCQVLGADVSAKTQREGAFLDLKGLVQDLDNGWFATGYTLA